MNARQPTPYSKHNFAHASIGFATLLSGKLPIRDRDDPRWFGIGGRNECIGPPTQMVVVVCVVEDFVVSDEIELLLTVDEELVDVLVRDVVLAVLVTENVEVETLL